MPNDLVYPQGLLDKQDEYAFSNDAVSAVTFKIHERKSSQQDNLEQVITLYMPETLESPINVSWDSASFGMGGESVLNPTENFLQKVMNVGGKAVDSSLYGIGNTMGSKLYGGGGDVKGIDIVNFKNKSIQNPYLKMLFRGVNFRNFEFLFKFTPHSEGESAKIKEIIDSFRKAALPAKSTTETWKFEYPKEVEIEYRFQDGEHPWLNKFKRCVITDMNVNYTGAGFYAQMRDGFPAETQMRLQFSEIELVTREDVDKGY